MADHGENQIDENQSDEVKFEECIGVASSVVSNIMMPNSMILDFT
jgi:hypothetical protein